MLFEIVNYIIIASVIRIAILIVVNAFTGSTAIDTSTDIGYGATLLINSAVSYIVPSLVTYGIFRKELHETKRLVPYLREPGDMVLLFFAGGCLSRTGSIVTVYISNFMNVLFNVPEPEAAFSDMMSQNMTQFLTFEFFSVIVAPICEEVIYRHLLLRPMRKYGDLSAAIISSLVFAISHFNFDQFLYTFFFGFALATAAIRRNSVKPAIIFHIINNLLAGLSAYVPETFGNAAADSIFAGLSTLADIAGMLLLYGGAIAVILACFKHLFTFKQPYLIPDKQQLKVIFTTPLVLIAIAASLALTFYLLYI